GRSGARSFIASDSGGFEPVAKSGIAVAMARQTRQAVREADTVVFEVDDREGQAAHDLHIARVQWRTPQRVIVALNKPEGMPLAPVAAEFDELGLGDPLANSAAHGDGVRDMIEIAFEHMGGAGMPEAQPGEDEEDAAEAGESKRAAARRKAAARAESA